MKDIVYFDIETETTSEKILDFGGIDNNENIFHSHSVKEFINFLGSAEFVCGHNIIRHDLRYIKKYLSPQDLENLKVIDTLVFSPLLFPTQPYHHLLKDDKLQTEELNNPVNDSIKARDLLIDEISAFSKLDISLKDIYHGLLSKQQEFSGFFDFILFKSIKNKKLESLIVRYFEGQICAHAPISHLIINHPVPLSYCLSLISTTDRYSITPPWVLKHHPDVEHIMYVLRNKPCLLRCKYCADALDGKKGLKDFFGFDNFRTFNDEPLQEKAVNAALSNRSLLAVFPTGGGKSLTFQIPALMAGRNTRGLTIVISPLQSLMKDQVDNLEKIGITEAVTINGLLDPIERGKSFERVQNGSAAILYISPESLRSKSIERLLLKRNIIRFVIDEAHCFSSWGQDFRVDYLYIGDFINRLQDVKNLSDPIPVSCFTATAKPKVIEDITSYFKDKLSIDLDIFKTDIARTNLNYKVYDNQEEQKYNNVRRLIESKDCPSIIYVSRTKKAYSLSERLAKDGFNAKPYHGKMDIKEKTANQDAFMSGEVQIIVATSAFGMGVDKKDIGLVIHYEISDSLENYIQEAGRAGRDEHISADCYILYDEEDLNKHFILLNQTKLSVKEIQQIWRAIKSITKYRSSVSNSALEIARKAGWDDNIFEIETRVKTAISALEQAGYIRRGQNIPRVFANSILCKNAQSAIDKINTSPLFNDTQGIHATRIIKKLFSAKSKKHGNDEMAEARIDYISDHLGIAKEEVINIITLLREVKILADTKDLTAFVKHDSNVNSSLAIVESFAKLELFLLPFISEQETIVNLKLLNEEALSKGLDFVSPNNIKTILNIWTIKDKIKKRYHNSSRNHISIVSTQTINNLNNDIENRIVLSKFIVQYLFNKIEMIEAANFMEVRNTLVEFSVHELRDQYMSESVLFKGDVTSSDIEDTLFYLSRIGAIKIEGGFMVIYNKLTIDRIEMNNMIQYKKEDYLQLDQFYKNKIQQIHIVGEYAQKMLSDYKDALGFVEDYFQLNYRSFLTKHFPGRRSKEIQQNITASKFKQLFDSLSPRQLKIINDNQSQHIVVAAGPGSGKTRVLIHKLASLLLLEDIKHEQLLMLTFSRASATEFKLRLMRLIGNAANYIEIKTFHSYCFDLLGRVGSIEKSDDILQQATTKIISGEVEVNRITKSVCVIDEAQDMNAHEYALIMAIASKNEEMRVIAVGDDDQNIYAFRGADSRYFQQFAKGENAKKYELVDNYRSKKNLVLFTNKFVERINQRFKTTPIRSIYSDNGNLNVYRYSSKNLIVPIVKSILSTELNGTTCVLTRTNSEALQVTGMLLKNGRQAKLIQSNDGFNLYHILELRSFIDDLNVSDDSPLISAERWNHAKMSFAKKHKESSNYDLCKYLLTNFQKTHPRKYLSDLQTFILESKLEDFSAQSDDGISVSTIHKAKGREFDNIILMLNGFSVSRDDNKRQLYVAMTRAKHNLTIHYNGSYLSSINVAHLETITDDNEYPQPRYLLYQLTHKDVNLGYFDFINTRLDTLICGDMLSINEVGLVTTEDKQVVRFSKIFIETLTSIQNQGFHLVEAKIRFILYWKIRENKKEKGREIKIVLPELVFER